MISTNKDKIVFGFLSRSYGKHQTTGHLTFCDGDKRILDIKTIEPPYLNNQKFISCINSGDYWVYRHVSPKFGDCFKIQKVPKRSNILFHPGSFKKNTKGCVLPGLGFADLDDNNIKDVFSSKNAMNLMFEKLPDKFMLIIR